jgi:peptidoglycan/xylan/chitin deacetylase (PgdA/CDA1 family)
MRVLCVHDVVSDQPCSPWEVQDVELENLLTSLLGRGYRFCSLDEVARADERSVAVTIDDAPAAAVKWLLGRSQAIGLRATLFPVVDWLDRAPRSSPEHAYRSLATWADVRLVLDQGHIIGSHGMSHLPMHNLTQDQIIYELNESKRRLEVECRTVVNHFAAPYGKLSSAVVSHAVALGYQTISSTVPGINNDNNLSECVLKRFVLRSDQPGLGIISEWRKHGPRA